jgi:class 3 adenylate cyclase/tetratricopeptide (TPR) repeat protein
MLQYDARVAIAKGDGRKAELECASCQHVNLPGRKFCIQCGTSLPANCPNCGEPLEAGGRFCGECGHELTGAATPAPAQLAPAPTQSAPSLAPGERRHATVMFSDLSGFTAMTERLDPEEVQGLMRRLKDGAVGIVEKHGGIVSQFVGDEVLALFGIPSAHEDDPVRAVRAAREIHTLARALSPEVEDRIGRSLTMHTGIDTGLVVTSTADVRDGTVGVTGDTVNTAARLKAAAEDDAVLLSGETQRQVGAFFDTEPMAALNLKGKSASVVPHYVTGEREDVGGRFEATSAQRGLTAFAGRQKELATLQEALQWATQGQGNCVTVIGEAGIGKSRLMHEFRQSVNREEVTVLEGRCQSYGAETPYLPFLDALRRGLRLHTRTDASALHATAVANIRAVSPELERYLPHLLHLLSIPSEAHRLPETLQGDVLRRELEEALAATLTLNTAHGPMVVIFEDWHWVDEASDTALNRLLGLVGHYPLLLVVLLRPEYTRKWADVENYSTLVLRSLEVAPTGQMLQSVLGADSLPPGLAEAVHARTGGNALFNEEMAHALREEGMVAVTNGSLTLTRPLDELVLPDTIHAVIRARVDRLDPDDREILRLASVIGREFDRAVLERISPSPNLVGSALERLARQDLVHQVRLLPQTEYIFKHVLTQEVVYDTLLRSQRKDLHAQVGAAIEALYPGRLEEHYEALADHYSQSDERYKAIDYLDKAGDKATANFSQQEARARYQQAAETFDGSEMGTPDAARMAEIAIKLREAAIGLPAAEMVALLEKACEAARSIGATELLSRAMSGCATIALMLSEFERSAELARQLLALPEEGCAPDARALGHHVIGMSNFYSHRNTPALECISASERWWEMSPDSVWKMSTYGHLGLLHGLLGNVLESDAWFERAADYARRAGVMNAEVWLLFWAGWARFVRGDWSAAEDYCARAVALGEELGEEFPLTISLSFRTATRFLRAPGPTTLLANQSALQRLSATGLPIFVSYAYALNSEAHCLMGDSVAALASAQQGLDQAYAGDGVGLVPSHRALGMALAAGEDEDWSQAVLHLETSQRLATEQGERPYQGIAHFRHAECLHKRGEVDAARHQLDAADTLFREVGMDWWTAQAESLRERLDSGQTFQWFAPCVDGPPKLD